MNEIIPAESGPGQISLLFEPSETVNSRAIALQKEVDKLRGARRGLWISVVLLLLLLLCIIMAGGSYIVFNQSQYTAMAEQVEEAEQQVEDAREAQKLAEGRVENLAQQARLLNEFAPIARLEAELDNQIAALDYYKAQFAGKPTPGLDRESTLELEIDQNSNVLISHRNDMETKIARIRTAIDELESWMLRESTYVEPPQVRCNPFDPSDRNC